MQSLEEQKSDAIRFYTDVAGCKPNEARALSTFFYEEAKLFHESLDEVYQKYPGFRELCNGFNTSLFLPFETAIEFRKAAIETYDFLNKDKNRHERLLKLFGEPDTNTSEFDSLKDKFPGFVSDLNSWLSLIEEMDKKFPSYGGFLQGNINGIIDHVKTQTLILSDDYYMHERKLRNQILKRALDPFEDPMSILGYEIRFKSMISRIISEYNVHLKFFYEWSQDNLGKPSGNAQILARFPEPLGFDRITEDFFYNTIVKNETPEKYSCLEAAINAHFDERAREVLAI